MFLFYTLVYFVFIYVLVDVTISVVIVVANLPLWMKCSEISDVIFFIKPSNCCLSH